MSTQDHSHIPLSYSTPQAPVRLLELPPALLSLIESDSPPILKLKSSPAPKTSSSHAVLCTPSQTFSIRQVQTSNSLYLLQPHAPTPCSDSDAFPEIPQPGLSIVSTATSYLELLPSTPDPIPELYQSLPVYHGWDTGEDDEDGDFAMQTELLDQKGYSGLLEHASVSDGEFLRAWTETGVFELARIPHRPSAAISLQLFNKLSDASLLSRIHLFEPSKPFATSNIWNAIEEDSLPIPFLEAFLRRVCDPMEGTWGGDAGWVITQPRLAACIGRLLLEAEHDKRKLLPRSSINATEHPSLPGFLKDWKDFLVDKNIESWLAPGASPRAEVAKVSVFGDAPAPAAASTGAAAGRGRGKWHEKFAAKKRK
ncbi:hypothetical protein BGX38DRAFT_1262018 [Terfezia claveryi]|nr:hypothetical protein BGX38DRAFT_1262018 [Terfezia claveryi]